MTKLSPPKNVRNATPRCCATCKYMIPESEDDQTLEQGAELICLRSNEAEWEDPDDLHYTVCDGYQISKGYKSSRK